MDVSNASGAGKKKRTRHDGRRSERQRRRCNDSEQPEDTVASGETEICGEPSVNDGIDNATTKTKRRVQGYDVQIPSTIGKAGQILRVKLVHFMCHDHFEVYFGNHVNFVSGKNGSGKSAILQAIQLCFGIKAFDTGRGKNAKGFIKTGCHYAKMQVTVWNTGSMAYRKNEFGRVITVERSFAGTGGRYVMISESGHAITTKKSDLDDMVAAFGIICKNPMVILTQGAASSFLRGKKLNADLYSLYMKATEFEDAAEEHAESYKQIQEQKNTLLDVKKNFEIIKEHESDLFERLERAREEKIASEFVVQAENVLSRVHVSEKQETKALVEESVQKATEALTAIHCEMETRREEREKIIQEREEFNEEEKAQGMRDVLKRLKTVEHALKDEKKEAERVRRLPKQQILSLTADIERLEVDKQRLEQNLEAQKNDDGEGIRAAKEAFEEEVQQRALRLQQTDAQLLDIHHSVEELQAEAQEKETAVKKLVDSCDDLSGKVRELSRSIHQLQQVQWDPLTVFGGNQVKALLDGIKSNLSAFDREPIGPIGRYLSVNDETWSLAIEFTIGRLFNAFIVHSVKDERTFRSLCRQLGPRIDVEVIIISCDGASYDIGVYEDPPYPTILKMLKIADFDGTTVLRNVLIDHGRIEAIVLWPSEEEAFRILHEHSRGPFIPSSVRLPSGRRVYLKGNSEVSMHDGRTMEPRLIKDCQHRIRQTSEKLEATKQHLRQKEKERAEQVHLYNDLEKRMENEQTTLHNLEQTRQLQSDDIQQLEDKGPSFPVFVAFDIESLKEEITSIDSNISKKQSTIGEAKVELAAKDQKVKDIEEKIAAHKTEFLQKRQDADELSKMVNDIDLRYRTATAELEKPESQHSKKQEEVDRLKADVQRIQTETEELIAKATEQCTEAEYEAALDSLREYLATAHDPEPLTSTKLEGLITDFKRKIRNYHLHSEERLEDLQAEYQETKENSCDMCAGIAQSDQLIAETEQGHKKRGEIYRKNQKRMDGAINGRFNRYMRKRGHHGTLKPVHRDSVVDIKVKISGQDETVCEMSSLSGGERSFTTVSLLLALASVVNSPFHCMDEFDVFTDVMTKHCAIQALLETAATEKTDSQFIFFSPQEVGTVEDVRRQINQRHMEQHGEALIPQDFVMLHEMAPPERESPRHEFPVDAGEQ